MRWRRRRRFLQGRWAVLVPSTSVGARRRLRHGLGRLEEGKWSVGKGFEGTGRDKGKVREE